MRVLNSNGVIQECLKEDEISILRHSAAHILAQAIARLYPNADFAYGPATDNGFYYDVDLGDIKLTEADLPVIENEMKKICKENLPFKTFAVSHSEAKRYLLNKEAKYKLEHLEDLSDEENITFFQQGEYVDMCVGPHISYTKMLKAFKLTSISGAYWKADKKNKMLTRINGIAFSSAEELEEHIRMLEEIAKRDHRKIAKEMGLFLTNDAGPGFPFFLDKGLTLKNTLIDYWREIHRRENYIEISTPIMLNRLLWETSGHWSHYRENMYTVSIEEEDFAIKPMNCPGGMLVYKSRPHSYRELPIRCGELGLVHRHELKGALHGLFRVRCFTQDDAHIFMTKEQIADEIKGVVRLIDEVYSKFGFKYNVELSTRPSDSMGSDEDWEEATSALKKALEDLCMPYEINEGDGAFYGPKIDFHLRDSIGRTWQCGTIQLDFQLPLNFKADYIDENNELQRPIMVHRVVFGSIERFMGILIEHYAGKFPTWLSPVQVTVLPISEKFVDYATNIYDILRRANIRCELDVRNEKIGYKIREAQQVSRVPYMVVIGEKEVASNMITVRNRDTAQSEMLTLDSFLEQLNNEIFNRIS